MNEFVEEEYVVINKNRLIKYILFAISTFIFFEFIDYINDLYDYGSKDIFYAIFSVGICIILNKVSDIKNDFFGKMFMIVYHLIGIESSIKLISIYLNKSNFLTLGEVEGNTITLFAICLLFHICQRRAKKVKKYYLSYAYLILLTFIILVILNKTVINKVIIIALNIICFYLILLFYKGSFFARNKKYKGSINVVYICFRLLVLDVFLNSIMIFVNDTFKILQYSYDFIFNLLFIIESSIILFSTINKPFKSILESLYIKNKQLDDMNQQIFRQNVFLEYSRGVIENKNKRLSSFFNNLPVPNVIINKDSERIRFCNKSFLELMGVDTYKKIINKTLFSLFEVEDNNFIKSLNSIRRGIINKNGNKRYVDIEIFNDNVSENSVVIFTEVTEQVKMLEMQEKIKNKEFEEQMKRDFLSNISHDLKTPINVIYTATQLMDIYCDNKNKEGINKYIDVCKNNYKILIKLTNALIDKSKNFSFYDKINLKIVNIVYVLKQNVNSLLEYAKSKGVNLIFNSSEDVIYIEVDIDCIERIVQNIISNSLKYYSENGEIKVSVSTNDNDVKIVFQDNGVGMDEETLRNVFERYSMGENSKLIKEKSTGIGLSIVKKMVNKQNGKINIYSKVNVGTKVEIIFKRVKRND